MELRQEIVWQGAKKGLVTTWELSKVIIPTALVITLLRESGGLEMLAQWFAPLMSFLGLPGEAAIALFSGYFINLYAAIGTMVALQLSANQLIILAVMFGFCHSMVVELAVSKKAGSPISYILPLRLGLSMLAGVVLGGILG